MAIAVNFLKPKSLLTPTSGAGEKCGLVPPGLRDRPERAVVGERERPVWRRDADLGQRGVGGEHWRGVGGRGLPRRGVARRPPTLVGMADARGHLRAARRGRGHRAHALVDHCVAVASHGTPLPGRSTTAWGLFGGSTCPVFRTRLSAPGALADGAAVEALADEARPCLERTTARRVCRAPTLERAVEQAHRLEILCRQYVLARAGRAQAPDGRRVGGVLRRALCSEV